MYVYYDGQHVKRGDRVHTGNTNGVIVKVLQPCDPESIAYNCSEGGLLIREYYPCKRESLLVICGERVRDAEDLRLIGRGK